MMSLWDALRMNMMISYQELVRTFLRESDRINYFKRPTCRYSVNPSTLDNYPVWKFAITTNPAKSVSEKAHIRQLVGCRPNFPFCRFPQTNV
ncbi:hypothetical protein C3451_18230 [Enterobacter sp. 301B]|nr:hypothetical protein C3451_18230 [Enterobacter sp. 301B]